MRVGARPLTDSPMEKLVVVDSPEADHTIGEVVAYLCPECLQADETLEQVWHSEDCHHAGAHGRSHYAEFEPDVPGRPHPELKAEHPLTMIISAETTVNHRAGELIGWYCDWCGNADEDAFELAHDRACDLAADYDGVSIQVARGEDITPHRNASCECHPDRWLATDGGQ